MLEAYYPYVTVILLILGVSLSYFISENSDDFANFSTWALVVALFWPLVIPMALIFGIAILISAFFEYLLTKFWDVTHRR